MALSYQVFPANITVFFEELEGSPIENFDSSRGFSATRRLLCAWDDRLKLAKELRGKMEITSLVVRRFLGHIYPYDTAAVVHDVRISPFDTPQSGSPPDKAEYVKAILDVTYRVPDRATFPPINKPPKNTNQSERFEVSGQFISYSHEGLFFSNDEVLDPPTSSTDTEALDTLEAPSRVEARIEWVYTVHEVPKLDPDLALLVNKVNQKKIVSPLSGFPFAAETLLYGGTTADPETTTDGEDAFILNHRFTVNPEGWNVFPRKGRTTKEPIFTSASAAPSTQFKPYKVDTDDFKSILNL